MPGVRALEKRASKKILAALIRATEIADECPDAVTASAVLSLAQAYMALPTEE